MSKPMIHAQSFTSSFGGETEDDEREAVIQGSKSSRRFDHDTIVADYVRGLTIGQVASAHGCSTTHVFQIVRRHGSIRKNRKYDVDESFFDTIDCESRAYWLGFLAADGCVVRSELKLTLCGRDAEHVRKFAHAIKSSHPVRLGSSHGYQNAFIGITSRRITEALAALGVVPNKSLVIKPAVVCPELERHYWRGVFDGDGNIYLGKSQGTSTAGLVGSYDMMVGFCNFCKSITPSTANVRKHKGVYQFSLGGRHAAAVLDKMYANSSISLDRKYQQYMNLNSLPRVTKWDYPNGKRRSTKARQHQAQGD